MKVAAPFLFAFALVNSACAASLGNIKQSLKDGGIVPNGKKYTCQMKYYAYFSPHISLLFTSSG